MSGKVSQTAAVALLTLLSGCGSQSQAVAEGPGDARTFTVYHDGTFSWPGDYSYSATPDYRDTSGGPRGGHHDIKVTLTGPWGAWQPFATHWVFDTTPYQSLRFALKPTQPHQTAQVYFMLVGDKPVGKTVSIAPYGPAPVVGEWAVYDIPLVDIGVSKTTVYKFAIQDQTGSPNNVFYVDDVMFVGGKD